MSYLDLPVGSLRVLSKEDITQRKEGYFGGNAFRNTISGTDQVQNTGGATGIPGGILIDVNQIAINGETWTFKPPKDRTWYLAQLQFVPIAFGNGNGIQVGDYLLDGRGLGYPPGNEFGFFTGGALTVWGKANQSIQYPGEIDPRLFIPIREGFSFGILIQVPTTPPQDMVVALMVWETLKTAPLKTPVNPEPAQTVDESWQ